MAAFHRGLLRDPCFCRTHLVSNDCLVLGSLLRSAPLPDSSARFPRYPWSSVWNDCGSNRTVGLDSPSRRNHLSTIPHTVSVGVTLSRLRPRLTQHLPRVLGLLRVDGRLSRNTPPQLPGQESPGISRAKHSKLETGCSGSCDHGFHYDPPDLFILGTDRALRLIRNSPRKPIVPRTASIPSIHRRVLQLHPVPNLLP